MQIMLCNFLFARCVYFDMAIKKWVGPDDVCQVTNNLDLGTDDFVDCSCKHMTSYAIVAKTTEAGLVGYTLWFYIACFICIVRVEEFVCSDGEIHHGHRFWKYQLWGRREA